MWHKRKQRVITKGLILSYFPLPICQLPSSFHSFTHFPLSHYPTPFHPPITIPLGHIPLSSFHHSPSFHLPLLFPKSIVMYGDYVTITTSLHDTTGCTTDLSNRIVSDYFTYCTSEIPLLSYSLTNELKLTKIDKCIDPHPRTKTPQRTLAAYRINIGK